MFRKMLRRRMSWSVTLLSCLVVFMIGVAPASAAGSAFTANTSFTFDVPVYIPCAAGGAGEVVEIAGTLHDLFHITFNAAGGITIKGLDNPQGITGVGLTTGTKYQATGGTQSVFTGTIGSTSSFINNFRIIGAGPGNNFLIHENEHVTVNANGTVTATFDNFRADCK